MKRCFSFIVFLFCVLLGTSAFADPEGAKQMVLRDGQIVLETVTPDPAIAENDNWKLGPLNSLTLSYGAMGYVYAGYGPTLDLVYYKQKSANSRHGVSLRWFFDNNHDSHYIGEEVRKYKCIQINMLSLAYQIQAFKRTGNWEFSIAGGFGLGVAFVSYKNERSQKELYEYDNRALTDDFNMGFLFWGLADDWDPFLDVSMTLGLEYYLSDYFSFGANASIHYHTFLYLDASASVQAKLLF